MFKEQRQSEILREIKDTKAVDAKVIAKKFKVSILTIRRDLNELSESNLLQRTHGGAIEKLDNNISEIPLKEKDTLNVAEKERIVKAVIKFIGQEDTVFIDGGSTNLRIARELKKYPKIKIITNALKIALESVNGQEMILLGGMVRGSSLNTVGELALAQLDNFFADKFIMGIDGIDYKHGLTTIELNESLVKSKMLSKAKEVIVVADSSKIGKIGSFKVCSLSKINMLVTDSKITSTQKKEIEAAGVEVVVC